MEIMQLKNKDFAEVIDLFCMCFYDDPFYSRLFSNPNTRYNDMKTQFSATVLYCIENGISYGIRENNELVGFVLCFDYFKTKESHSNDFYSIFGADNNDASLPYYETMHKKIEQLGSSSVIFCLSVAVKEQYRRMGLASVLVEKIISSCGNSSIVSDISNQASLNIYLKRKFSIEKIDEDYYFVVRKAKETTDGVFSNTVRLAVSSTETLDKLSIRHKVLRRKFAVLDVDVAEHNGDLFFIESENRISFSSIVEISYKSLLLFQRFINLSQNDEKTQGDVLYYTLNLPYENPLLMNSALANMLPLRSSEWNVVPDTYVSVPMQYKDINRIVSLSKEGVQKANKLLRLLDYRTKYEVGIPSKSKKVDELSNLKTRIQRFYLGKVRARILDEISVDNYELDTEVIGEPAFIDLYISLDMKSECAVLSWYSLSTPFLISHYMDNIIRNQLSVYDGCQWVNIYDYLNERFAVVKRGTPKIFATIPEKRTILTENQLASMLAAETIYPEGQDFGSIIDTEILQVVSSTYGMGQYDRGFVGAYTNSVLQFSPDLICDINSRLNEESITLFYIELILMEEAAIHIVDQETVALFTSEDFERPIEFLKHVEKIYDSYSKTIDFWNIRVNYPTSQKSIIMLRNAFKVDEQRESMNRNQEHLKVVFSTKSDIIDRSETKRMNTSLAILSVFAVFSAWMDSHDFLETWAGVLSDITIDTLQLISFAGILIAAVYVISHLFGPDFLFSIKKAVQNLINRRKK